jgi:hypothetical protein
MPNIDVKLSSPTLEERILGAFEPMRWATQKASGKPIYIGTLTETQNGNACDCNCPSCGEDLQAVNAGKDASHFAKPGTRGMFFRHTSGHQRGDCGFLAAKLAALHLLMEQGELDLPAPRMRRSHRGISGKEYFGESEGSRWRGQIQSKVWLDDQSAQITLDDGRVVHFLLRARPKFSSDGAVDGVILIEIDDQALASWSPEEILDRLKLNNGLACWQQHWDDPLLEAAAERMAAQAAENALDALPEGLSFPEGLTQFQKSESILHAKVKELLAEEGKIRVPRIAQQVSKMMDDGNMAVRIAELKGGYLQLSDVRLEFSLKGLVPDVMCQARWIGADATPFTLLIEVAVTHRVDEKKKKKIQLAGLACIEIDLSTVSRGTRRITLAQLQREVIHEIGCKDWIFNPIFIARVREQRMKLEAQNQALQAERQAQLDRSLWLSECDEIRLLQIYLLSLRQVWDGMSGTLRIDEGLLIDGDAIFEQMSLRGFNCAQDTFLVSDGGLLCLLDGLHRSLLLGGRYGDRLRSLRILESNSKFRKYLSVGLLMAKVKNPKLAPDENRWFDALRQAVRKECERDNLEFLRPKRYDDLFARLFPEIREVLRHPFGTLDAYETRQRARRDQKQRAILEEARLLQRAEDERRIVRDKIDEILSAEKLGRWITDPQRPPLESVLGQLSIKRLAGNYLRSNLDVVALLTQACAARDNREPFRLWFEQVAGADIGKAKMMLEALRLAGLVERG